MDGRGFDAFPGEKKLVRCYRSYLIVATKGRGEQLNRWSLTIYDKQNAFIAFQRPFDDIVDVIPEFNALYVVTKDRVVQLQEKDLNMKIATLFKRNLHQKAIDLARSEKADQAQIMECVRQYADHLYKTGDFNGAIEQYKKTVNSQTLEPSFVIRKFLDAQRIKNLTDYLKELHENGKPTSDHTTLLLNCYTKQKDKDALDEFIKNDDSGGKKFDVPTAIRVCRQAGLHEHARYLSKKHGYSKTHLSILLELANDSELKKDKQRYYEDACDFISTLEFSECEKNLKEYGKVLLEMVPEKTVELLHRLCTDYRPSGSEEQGRASADIAPPDGFAPFEEPGGDKARASAEDFIHIFVGDPARLTDFLEFITEKHPNSSSNVYNTLLELHLRAFADLGPPESANPAIKDRRGKSPKQKEAEKNRRDATKKIEKLLKSNDATKNPPIKRYDEEHALVLCKLYNFEKGIILLYEKKRLWAEILQLKIKRGDAKEIMRACARYSERDSNLWKQALNYFAENSVADQVEQHIPKILNQISEDNLLPPLMVIKILSKNRENPITLSVLKDYIVKYMVEQRDLIEADQNDIKQYEAEIRTMKEDIEELKTQAKTFQHTKCTACQMELDLPVVHFMCGCSFHVRCLQDEEKECPDCSIKYNRVRDKHVKMRASSNDHDQFFRQLRGSKDPFSTVAEYFGRGVINSGGSEVTT